MTVLCGTCNAENRDAAKFCKGCGRKIAQAWPQAVPVAAGAGGAALLSGSVNPPLPAHQRAAAEEELRPAPAPPRARVSNGRWIAGLGLGVLLLVVAAGWWGQRNKSQEIAPPPASALDAATSPPPAVEPPPPLTQAPATSEPPTAAQSELVAKLEPSPAPEAAATPANAKARKPAARKQPAPTPAPVVEAAAPAPVPAAPEPVRVPTPQESCAGRNFIARAQCMADQCARPEVASHPQCDAVRRQQRLEEEKRNPTMAN